ncbi:MAG TPA: cyclic nucleotide-binding and patatin-like phospholipase domain-containing protein [Chloroflexota bacterium]|nr:cyclic nucleotide-binding and patatin-like phospholipase domain-containing protein [Chloroflexota bacterium]
MSPAARPLTTPLNQFAPFMGLDPSIVGELEAHSTIVELEPGETLFKQGEPGDALYIVITGSLEIRLEHAAGPPHVLAKVLPGDCLGEMALLAHQPRTATAVAIDSASLLEMPTDACERLIRASPEVKDRLVGVALRRLPSLYLASSLLGGLTSGALVELDRSATLVRLVAGQTLFQQGDPSDALYVVTHGSVEVVVLDQQGARRVVDVLGRGAFLGEMGVLLNEPRTATVRARRDAELIRIPHEAFERAISVEPKVAVELARQLARRIVHADQQVSPAHTTRTVAVLPLDRSPESTGCARQLAAALGGLLLTEQSLESSLGSNDLADTRLRQWLLEQEEQHPYLVYAADHAVSAWTRLTLRQADIVLLVGRAASDPRPSPVERELMASGVHAPVELVLLHQGGGQASGSAEWLRSRKVGTVHQVRLAAGSDGDLARVARSIQGTSTCLVLGGGGARGLAHLGVIRAVREAGLPIDRVAGTSMGAIIAALCAMGHDPATLIALTRRHYAEGGGFDMTLPIVALRSARQTVRTLRTLFGDTRIEDLFTPFFCVSADLTRAEVVVHDAGPMWLAVRASCALPGLVPPVAYHGDLLVDGGLLNNLPTDVMRQRSSGSVIAVDVSPKVDLTVASDGPAEVSGWLQLWERMRPDNATNGRFPSIVEVLSRAVLLGSVRDSQASGQQADLYLHPPVDAVPMGAFKSIDAVVEVGYRYAAQQLEAWLRERKPEAQSTGGSSLL